MLKKADFEFSRYEEGEWASNQPPKVVVGLVCLGTRRTFDMKNAICKTYGKSMSNELYRQFCKDIKNGLVRFEVDSRTNIFKLYKY